MEFNLNENREVVALLGAGSMGTAIIKRISTNRIILLGDINEDNLKAREEELKYNGYAVETQVVDAMDAESVEAFAKRASELGNVKYYIHTAGASPNQASPEHIINLDLVATSLAIDIFGKYMAKGGAGLIISSQTGYMMNLPPEVEQQIAFASTDELTDLDFIKNEPKEKFHASELKYEVTDMILIEKKDILIVGCGQINYNVLSKLNFWNKKGNKGQLNIYKISRYFAYLKRKPLLR